jgi:hypothetical protein
MVRFRAKSQPRLLGRLRAGIDEIQCNAGIPDSMSTAVPIYEQLDIGHLEVSCAAENAPLRYMR